MNTTHTNHTKLKNFLVKHSLFFTKEVFNYIDSTESLTGESISIEQGNNFVYWHMVNKHSMNLKKVFEQGFEFTDETSALDALAYYIFREENFGMDTFIGFEKDEYKFYGYVLGRKQFERIVKKLNAGEEDINIFEDSYNDNIEESKAFLVYGFRVPNYICIRKGNRIYLDRNVAKDKFYTKFYENREKQIDYDEVA